MAFEVHEDTVVFTLHTPFLSSCLFVRFRKQQEAATDH